MQNDDVKRKEKQHLIEMAAKASKEFEIAKAMSSKQSTLQASRSHEQFLKDQEEFERKKFIKMQHEWRQANQPSKHNNTTKEHDQ